MAKKVTQSNEIKLVTNVVSEKQLRKAQLRALKLFSDTVAQTYGPMGGYAAYSIGDPENPKNIIHNYTKDGFTVHKHIECDKPIESLIKDEIRTICTQVIKNIGDGTTSAIMLSYNIFEGLLRISESSKAIPKRQVIKTFQKIIDLVIKRIESNGHEATLDDIYNIALTSLNGQEEYAETIKKVYEEYGMDVFIDVGISNDENTIVKSYSGMTYDTGYISPCFINMDDNTCTLPNADVFVFESPIDTPDMIGILQMIIAKNIEEPAQEFTKARRAGKEAKIMPIPTVIICPHISRDANSYLDSLINTFSSVPRLNRFPLCIVSGITNYNDYLLDIMSMTGARFIKKYIDPETKEKDKEIGLAPTEKTIHKFAGKAEKVVIDALSTRIINPKNMYDENHEYSEFFNNYIDQLKDLLHKYEETRVELVKIGQLKRRINILQGNMVDLYVGGVGIADRDSLKDSIEDAVLNCRSAAKDGVGYGANYEGLRVLNQMSVELDNKYKQYKERENELNEEEKNMFYDIIVDRIMTTVLTNSYISLVTQLYLPYCDGNTKRAIELVITSLAAKDEKLHMPFNIVTEQYDGKVLTSIKTEPSMLHAISRIISLLLNTNQFLLPDARFNIYEMTEDSSTTIEEVSTEEEKPEIPVTEEVKEEVVEEKQENTEEQPTSEN